MHLLFVVFLAALVVYPAFAASVVVIVFVCFILANIATHTKKGP